MRPDGAVRGTVLVGLVLLAAALGRPAPAPVGGPIVRVGGRWETLASLGAPAVADVHDGDTVRVVGGYALPVRTPAPVAWRGPTSLNRASLAELEALPGVGPSLAERIVAARPFRRVRELDRVKGIGPKRLAALVSLVAP